MPFLKLPTSKKCSEALSVLTFWPENVLCATRACHFSNFQLPKAVWTPQLFNILTWKCASRHSGVRFLVSYLTTWLFAPSALASLFGPSPATNHWKNKVIRDFPTFRALDSSLLFSLCLFFPLLFIFPYMVGSLTVKLPSMIYLLFSILILCHICIILHHCCHYGITVYTTCTQLHEWPTSDGDGAFFTFHRTDVFQTVTSRHQMMYSTK